MNSLLDCLSASDLFCRKLNFRRQASGVLEDRSLCGGIPGRTGEFSIVRRVPDRNRFHMRVRVVIIIQIVHFADQIVMASLKELRRVIPVEGKLFEYDMPFFIRCCGINNLPRLFIDQLEMKKIFLHPVAGG